MRFTANSYPTYIPLKKIMDEKLEKNENFLIPITKLHDYLKLMVGKRYTKKIGNLHLRKFGYKNTMCTFNNKMQICYHIKIL